MHFLSSFPTRCQLFCGDLQSDTWLPCGWKAVMLLGEGGRSREDILFGDKEKGKGGKGEGLLEVKEGIAAGVALSLPHI